MKYMIAFREPAEEFVRRDNPEQAGDYWGAWTAYVGALHQSGVVVSGAGLHGPHAASTVRLRDGAREVHDGPFADAKEQLGGFFIIEVPDLDVALDWASRSPAALTGSVEVRPVMPPPAPPAA